jgi:hypothetical protein
MKQAGDGPNVIAVRQEAVGDVEPVRISTGESDLERGVGIQVPPPT